MLCSVAPCNNYKRSGGRRTPFVITICAASVSGGMDSSVKKIIYILLLSCVLITGCAKNKKIDIDKVQSSVNEYYDEFRAGYLRGEIAVTNKPLIGRDGEITRYTDKNGNIIVDDILEGKYYLKEVKAKNGYILDNKLIEIDIKYQENIDIEISNNKIEVKAEPKPKKVERILPVTGY